MADIQNIYSILLARGYQDILFQRLSGQRKKEGKEIRVDCPLCGSEGNFSYSSEKPLYHCWSCSAGGDWLNYMERVEGKSFQIALQELASQAGVELSAQSQEAYQSYTKRADILEEAQELFIKNLMEDKAYGSWGGEVGEYLAKRGYSCQEWLDMELGAYTSREELQAHLKAKGFSEKEIKDSGLLTGGFGEDYQLVFLWKDASGRAIGIVGRPVISEEERKERGIPKYKYSSGLKKDNGLIGFSKARGSHTIVLLEGVLDALYLNSMGYKTVAVGGASLSPEQIQALQLSGTKELLLALDMDDTGQKSTERIIRDLAGSSLRAYVISLPEGYKDADELVREKGSEAFQRALDKAERWTSWMARRIFSKHDTSTDRGMDSALEEAQELYSELEDAILAKSFKDSLLKASGLTEEELAGRLEKASQLASSRRAQALLENHLQDIQKKAEAGDLIGAEAGMDKALREVRTVRGLKIPEPYSLEELSGDILETQESLRTGWEKLDELARIPNGALTIIAGRPGQGKTTFQLNLLDNLLQLYPDKRFYYFSYEEARMAIALKLIMIRAGVLLNQNSNYEAYINYMKTKRDSVKTSDRNIELALQEYEKLTSAGRLLICDEMYPVEDLATVISLLNQRGDTGAVIVDYIQKISPGQAQSQRYLDIKLISSRLVERAVKLKIPIILGAQLGRGTDGSKPKLENLRESGDIEQDANLVLSLYTKAVEDMDSSKAEVPMEVSILKNRAGASDRKVDMVFNRPALKITEKAGIF
jgi:DNA primase catalytic core